MITNKEANALEVARAKRNQDLMIAFVATLQGEDKKMAEFGLELMAEALARGDGFAATNEISALRIEGYKSIK